MKFDPTLYVITDSTYHTTETLLHAVEEACRGGATLIQLREKETGGRAYLELAQQVKAVTDRFQVPLIIDDRVDVAIACERSAGRGLPKTARPGQDRRRDGKIGRGGKGGL